MSLCHNKTSNSSSLFVLFKTLAGRLLQSCLAVCISLMRTHCSSLCSLFLFDWLLFDQSCLNSCLNIYVANCEDAVWLWPNWQDINCSLLSTPCGRQVLPHAWQPPLENEIRGKGETYEQEQRTRDNTWFTRSKPWLCSTSNIHGGKKRRGDLRV